MSSSDKLQENPYNKILTIEYVMSIYKHTNMHCTRSTMLSISESGLHVPKHTYIFNSD